MKKTKNSRLKGKKFESEVKAILEKQGWLVETCNPKLQFIGPGRMISKAHDFFGKWDIIAKKEQTLWVQVSVWEKNSDKIKQVSGFPVGVGDITQIWARVQGRNAHFKILEGPNYTWEGKVEMVKKNKKA